VHPLIELAAYACTLLPRCLIWHVDEAFSILHLWVDTRHLPFGERGFYITYYVPPSIVECYRYAHLAERAEIVVTVAEMMKTYIRGVIQERMRIARWQATVG
jgi:hypothetical protein